MSRAKELLESMGEQKNPEKKIQESSEVSYDDLPEECKKFIQDFGLKRYVISVWHGGFGYSAHFKSNFPSEAFRFDTNKLKKMLKYKVFKFVEMVYDELAISFNK